MPGFIGMPELVLFGIVALLIFGPKRLPEMGRSLGRGLREFKDSVTNDGSDSTTEADPEAHKVEVLTAVAAPSSSVEANDPASAVDRTPERAPA